MGDRQNEAGAQAMSNNTSQKNESPYGSLMKSADTDTAAEMRIIMEGFELNWDNVSDEER